MTAKGGAPRKGGALQWVRVAPDKTAVQNRLCWRLSGAHPIGATIINPEPLTGAEKPHYEGYLRREETNAAIMALAKNGAPIKQIVRRTGHSRKLVSQVFRVRQCTHGAHLSLWMRSGRMAGAS